MTVILNIIKHISGIVIAYLVFFVLNEILISGGKSQQNPYLIIFNVITIIVILWFLKDSYYGKPLKQRIIESITYLIVFATLDFLLVNMLLDKMSFHIYKTYYTYVYYGLLFVPPIALDYIRNILPLDKPDSNHIIR